jgi:membrane carboxypeptidase/penicillin-binding protein PbpC
LPRTYILKIEDATGKTVDEWKPDKGEQVVRPDAAYIVADMMSDPRASYFSSKINDYKGHKFSIKTGTTNDTKDGLLMGFSTQYAAGVWVGYHNRRVEMTGFMENMTRPIWTGFMDKVHDNLTPEPRQKPSGVQTLPAFVVRNHVGTGSIEPSPTTDLFPSWYKKRTSNGKKQTIDIISNKLATECTPDLAKKDVDDADASFFSGDTLVSGNSANTTESDDVHKCEDVKPQVSVSAPASCPSSCTITASLTQGTHPLAGSGDKGGGKVNIKVDGQTVQSFDIGESSVYSMTYNPDFSGSKAVTAEVIDSVLYSTTSQSQTVNFSAAGGSLVLNASASGVNVNFSWNGNTGSTSVYKVSGNTLICAGTSSCSGTKVAVPTGTQVYAKDSSNRQSSNVTVTY